jgi:hypothetical protein
MIKIGKAPHKTWTSKSPKTTNQDYLEREVVKEMIYPVNNLLNEEKPKPSRLQRKPLGKKSFKILSLKWK